MATDVQIASLALSRIGHAPIASFSASGDKAQRWFQANYEFIRQSLLREHGWRCAIKRAVLTSDGIFEIDTVLFVPSTWTVNTVLPHGFSNGDIVYIDGVVGLSDLNGKTYTVAAATSDTFQLSGFTSLSDFPGLYSSGGNVYDYVAKEYAYRFPLPVDCLRLLRINATEADEYRVEQGYIYTDEGSVHIEYIFDQTDESAFDAQFTDVLAARLSAEISFYLTDNSTLTEQAWKIANDKLAMARTMDSRQGTPRGIDADQWLNARA